MKLSTMIKNLQKTLEEHGDLIVVFAKDDEGNGFDEIHFTPSVGVFKGEHFYGDSEKEDYELTEANNAVCVN